MKRSLIFPVMIAAVISGPAVRADDQADIRALYPKMCALFVKKDVEGIMKTGTADFKMKQGGQTMDGPTTAKMMKQEFAAMTVKSATMTPTSIKISGNKAVVLSDSKTTMVMKMPDGKDHTIVSTGKGRDTLVKTKAGWKFQMVESLGEKTTMDGKPFDPSKMAPPPGGGKK